MRFNIFRLAIHIIKEGEETIAFKKPYIISTAVNFSLGEGKLTKGHQTSACFKHNYMHAHGLVT
jgi:hypothetical protein